jgi:hypothetical protein
MSSSSHGGRGWHCPHNAKYSVGCAVTQPVLQCRLHACMHGKCQTLHCNSPVKLALTVCVLRALLRPVVGQAPQDLDLPLTLDCPICRHTEKKGEELVVENKAGMLDCSICRHGSWQTATGLSHQANMVLVLREQLQALGVSHIRCYAWAIFIHPTLFHAPTAFCALTAIRGAGPCPRSHLTAQT